MRIVFWLIALSGGFLGLRGQVIELLDAEDASLIQALSGDTNLDLNAIGKRALDLRYTPGAAGAGSVVFILNDGVARIDAISPYQLGGTAGGVDGAWLPKPGTYTVEIKEFSEVDGTGTELASQSLTLTISDALSHRMRPVRLETELPNTRIRVRMLKHAFPFGSMTNEPGDPAEVQISLRGSTDEQIQQDIFLAHFNYTVSGNQMKWYTQQPDWWSGSPHNTNYATPGQHRYNTTDNWSTFMQSQNVPMRGHAIFWGEKADNEQTPTDLMHDPDWVEALGTNALYWIEQRAKSLVGRYAGLVDDWDFVNELWHGDWYRDTFGVAITKQMADWVLEVNPNARLWFNEYDMLSSTSNSEQFRTLLEQLILEGVPVDGIGCQAHFGSAPDAATVKASLDILDDLGRPIMLTEFDCGWGADNTDAARELEEADGLEAVYRTAFEHKAVAGIIMWGFWEGNHWQPQRALWLNDWTPTAQALRYQTLVLDEWWTDHELVTDSNGEVEFAAFAGDYELDIGGDLEAISLSAGDALMELTYQNSSIVGSSGLEIQLTRPVTGNNYAKSEAVEFLAKTTAGTAAITQVEFFADDVLIKSDYTPPYTAVWLNPDGGSHSLHAVVTDANNATATSDTHTISVIWDEVGNLLQNQGFEEGTSNWTVFGAGTLTTVSDPVYDGSHAALLSGRAATWNGIQQEVLPVLEIDKNYIFTARTRLTTGSDTCLLTLRIAYADGSEPDYNDFATETVDANQWALLRGEFTYAPDPTKTVSSVTLYLSGPAAGTDFYADGFFLEEAEPNVHDADFDGMWDTWETSYFGSLSGIQTDAYDDYDGDGVNNFWEFRAGTDPTSQSSALRVTDFAKTESGYRLDWSSQIEKSYRILYTSDLDSGDWSLLLDQIEATATTNSRILMDAGERRFYRVDLDE